MSDVPRFYYDADRYKGFKYLYNVADSLPAPHDFYVLYKDYDALAARLEAQCRLREEREQENDALAARVAGLQSLLVEVYDQVDIVRGNWFERTRRACGLPPPPSEADMEGRMCKHDDGDCHWDDPCDNCPLYPKSAAADGGSQK